MPTVHVSIKNLQKDYRQPGLLCTPQNLAPSSTFLGKK
jgi:hypothetical protein